MSPSGQLQSIQGAVVRQRFFQLPLPGHQGLGRDFVDDVRKAPEAGKAALVCEIRENWTDRVDVRMAQVVFNLSRVRRTREEDDLAAMQTDVDQLKVQPKSRAPVKNQQALLQDTRYGKDQETNAAEHGRLSLRAPLGNEMNYYCEE